LPSSESLKLVNQDKNPQSVPLSMTAEDNPYFVAEQWLLKEGLPLTYREQIVQFILQNTGQANVPLDNSFVDPYTGANAYMPGQPSSFMSDPPEKYNFKHISKEGNALFRHSTV
jgi:phospholipase A-2-activating protein